MNDNGSSYEEVETQAGSGTTWGELRRMSDATVCKGIAGDPETQRHG
jgi:hypothetical protein